MSATLQDLGPIQKLGQDEVRLLWHADFWDGPINGLCQCGNSKYWFELLTDVDGGNLDSPQRRFLVLELTPAELAEEERWHELFRQKVGTHCDYDEPHPAVKPAETHREFYEAYQKRPKPDYSHNPVVAWFELG